jgi:Tfp pilus assembly protein PilF
MSVSRIFGVATHLAVFLATFLFAGCATVQQEPVQSDSLLVDQHFQPPKQPISVDDIFAMTPQMTQFLRTEMAASVRRKGPQHGLVDALYSSQQLRLEYDAKRTLNAREAFESKSGNCISLVIMTAAFARAMNIPVYYNELVNEVMWTRSGDLHAMSGHVNLTIGRRIGQSSTATVRSLDDDDIPLTVDFTRLINAKAARARNVRESTVVAMYFNNRAAELIAEGDINEAYWMAREALLQDPRYLPAVNTLAVVLRRANLPAKAEQVLRYVLAREPANALALANLAVALRTQGKTQAALDVDIQLAKLEPYPPFYFFDEGVKAMKARDFKTAIKNFEREVERDAYYHEVHFWLAGAYAGLGNSKAAHKHMTIALETSTSNEQKGLYGAKLAVIQSALKLQ